MRPGRRAALLAVATALSVFPPAGLAAGKMVILIIGAPGSGKTTQAKNLSKHCRIPAISMAEILDNEAGWQKTKFKKAMKAQRASGDLVSDEMANSLLAKYISKGKAVDGFILDGYPLNETQARYLDRLLATRGLPEPVVIHLRAPDAVVIECLRQRGRADDEPAIIERRLADYHAEAGFVLSRYKARLHEIDGTLSPDEVWTAILRVLGDGAGAR